MKIGFYSKMAWQGMRKNRKYYLPYLLSAMAMVAIFYIITMLSTNPMLATTAGGGTMSVILILGKIVVSVFSLLFLFYTHSFLIKRRKKEFGLYNVLGMGKKGLFKVLFWETLHTAVFTFIGGFAIGILFSKLAELALLNVTGNSINYSFYISKQAIKEGSIFFGIIFVLILLNSVRQIQMSKPVEMLNSEKAGEKPPKSNKILGMGGVILLAWAYYIALTTVNPIKVIMMFFVAVIMVIIATYLIFIAGSVLFCRMLQKNKKFYYKPDNFVSLSSMVYRMKRNGAGLATICILSTMVLVLVSSTTVLYRGLEKGMDERYPREMSVVLRTDGVDKLESKYTEEVDEIIERTVKSKGEKIEDELSNIQFIFGADLKDDKLELIDNPYAQYGKGINVNCISLEDYRRITGDNVELASDEIILHPVRMKLHMDKLTFMNGKEYKVKKITDDLEIDGRSSLDILPSIYVVLPDFFNEVRAIVKSTPEETAQFFGYNYITEFNIKGDDRTADELVSSILENTVSVTDNEKGFATSIQVMSKAGETAVFRELYGGLYFIGILLSIAFLLATVLIIYFKQISEGYEDQNRFAIMKNVGMTKKEIKRSINKQILMVFFLPLGFAGLHLAFAFPMIRRLLIMFNIWDTAMMIGFTVLSFGLFAAFYAIIYKITSNAYYSIVSGN